MKATIAVAFAAVFATFAYGTKVVQCPARNGEDVTLLPNPNDCTSYIACNDGIPWPMKCPGRLRFNAELRVCDDPEHVKCIYSNPATTEAPVPVLTTTEAPAPVTTTTEAPTPVTTTTEAPAPVTTTTEAPAPVTTTTEAPAPVTTTTEAPAPVTTTTEAPAPVTTTTEAPAPVTTTTEAPAPVTTTTKAPEPVTTTTEAPAPVTTTTEAPAPVTTTTETPEPVTTTTEAPEPVTTTTEAPAPVTTTTEAPAPVTTATEAPAPVSTTAAEIHPPTKPGNRPTPPKVQCPAKNGEDVTLLPNSDDCTSYIACNDGIPWPMKCPAGLHFNAELRVCDYPEHAKCGLANPATTDAPAPVSTTAAGTHPPTKPGSRPPRPVTRPTPPGSRPTPPSVQCPAKNGEDVTLLPNKDDCTSYIACNDGIPWPMKCPAGLHFNAELRVCDYPEHAKCGLVNPATTDAPAPVSTTAAGTHPPTKPGSRPPPPPVTRPPPPPVTRPTPPKVQCPAKNGEDVTLLPNKDDCTSYIACNDGIPWPMKCPAGLHFNAELRVCDYPEHAKCGLANPATTDAPAPVSTTAPGTHPPTKPGSRPPRPVTRPPPPGSRPTPPSVQCPAKNGEDVTLLPNKDDCTSYIACNDGIPWPMKCPAGLHFNAELRVCDYPEHAKCGLANPATTDAPAPVSTTAPGTHPPTKPGSRPPRPVTRPPPPGSRPPRPVTRPPPPGSRPTPPSVQCPAKNGEDVTLLPNKDDCTSYIACNDGIPWPMKCPAGLHFNAELRVCDYPEHAKCGLSNPATTDAPAPVSTTAAGVHPPIKPGSRPPRPVTRPPPPGSRPTPPSVQCPAKNGEDVTLLPNKADCTSYIACNDGIPWPMKCPAGLHFNAELRVCDYPEHAKCVSV